MASEPLLSLQSIAAAPRAKPSPDTAARTAEQFEALVIAQFLEPLFASVETPGVENGGADAFDAMLREQYAAAIAERGGFGIADAVRSALIEQQAARDARAAV